MRLYVQGYHGFCRGNDCLRLPTWNHLWFVAYLWAYTMMAGLMVWLLGARFNAVGWAGPLAERLAHGRAAGRRAGRCTLHVWPTASPAPMHWWTTGTTTPSTSSCLRSARCWPAGGILASGGSAALDQPGSVARQLGADRLLLVDTGSAGRQRPVQQWKPVMRTIYCLCQWAPILTVCGFGHRHLNFDSAKRRYLTEAVFPVYILHQTLIVSMAHWLKPVKLAPATEGLILIVLTFSISFGVFEVVRRIAVLRPLFGLAALTSQTSAYAGQAPAAAASDGHVQVITAIEEVWRQRMAALATRQVENTLLFMTRRNRQPLGLAEGRAGDTRHMLVAGQHVRRHFQEAAQQRHGRGKRVGTDSGIALTPAGTGRRRILGQAGDHAVYRARCSACQLAYWGGSHAAGC
jgi:hypothetical protein